MKTILLIEDDKVMRENTAEILELANYKVVTASNGKIGSKMAAEINPDLVICDIMMPELDGYGVLHILSLEPKTASIPFIFLLSILPFSLLYLVSDFLYLILYLNMR